MKKLGKFSARRSLSYLLAKLAGSRSAQDDAHNTQHTQLRAAKALARGSRLRSTTDLQEFLNTTQRRWPTRYY